MISFCWSNAHLIEVFQQICRIGIDSVCTCPHEFVLSVPARQEPDTERSGAPGRKQIPDTVPNHDGVADIDTRRFAAARNKSGSGFA